MFWPRGVGTFVFDFKGITATAPSSAMAQQICGAATIDGVCAPMLVKSIEVEGYTATTYNLTVANAHTFFVGEERVWVHNQNVDCGDGPDLIAEAPNGTIEVDASRAERGTPEFETLNNPPPNTRVELDNGTTFRTNEAGFVEEISYTPVDDPGVRDGRTTKVGKEGIAGDVGGHIQACRQGGTCHRFNLFPQNGHFNSSAYRRWENEMTRRLQRGEDVGSITVRFDRSNSNSARPDAVRVEYTNENGVRVTERFPNRAGVQR